MRIPLYKFIIGLMMWLGCCPVWADGSTASVLSQYKDYLAKSNDELFSEAKAGEMSGNDELALTCYNIIENRLDAMDSDGEASLLARCLSSKGLLHYRTFNYREAMLALLRCLDVCENNHLDSLQVYALKTIGNIYSQYGDYERSSAYYRQGLAIARTLGPNAETQHVLYNMAITSAESGHLDVADSCLTEFVALGQCHAHSDYEEQLVRGVIAKDRDDHKTAIHYFRLAEQTALGITENINYLGSARSCLARELARTGDLTHALELYLSNEADAKQYEQLDMLTMTYKELAETYALMGNQRKEMEYKLMYLDMNEKTFSMAAFNSLKNAQFLHDLNRSQAAIDQLSHESMLQQKLLSQQRAIMIVIGISLLVLAVMVIIVWRQKAHLSAVYEDLFKRNLDNLQQEKIYRHRLKEAEETLRQLRPQTTETEEEADNETYADNSLASTLVLERVRVIMEQSDEYLQSSFSIDRMAQLTHATPRLISKVINEEYGQNFRSFLNEYRIKEAMNRLADTENYGHLTIKAIAESVGYKSQSNFIAVFARITGIKPSDYQRLLQKQQQSDENKMDEQEEEI